MRRSSKTSPIEAVTIALWRRLQEGGFILLSALSLFLLVALVSYQEADPGWSHTTTQNAIHNAAGKTGAWFSDFFLFLFGYMAYLFPIITGYAGIRLFQNRFEVGEFNQLLWILRIVGFLLAVISGCGLASLHFEAFASGLPFTAGGVLGQIVMLKVVPAFGRAGSTLLLLSAFLAGITLTTGLSWFGLMDWIKKSSIKSIIELIKSLPILMNQLKTKFEKWNDVNPGFNDVGAGLSKGPITKSVIVKKEKRETRDIDAFSIETEPMEREVESVIRIVAPRPQSLPKPKPKPQSRTTDEYWLPSVALLEENTEASMSLSYSPSKLEALSREVESRLLEFGVQVTVVAVLPGPVITRFELELAPGVKVAKISSLSKDLARALSVTRVRVVEVIPGKSVVGLEIPNEHRELVRLREIIESSQYSESNSPLTLALGKDISGEPVVVNLAKMPHLLVAGTTGSGKSVGVNAMLLSLLFKASVDEVRLILIDPKMLELSIYDGIPHLLTPVVTDMKDAANVLRWCVAEMERRYQLMAANGVRNLSGYNRKILDAEAEGKPLLDPFWQPEMGGERPQLSRLPYIVVIIDEFADMMMVVGKKVEELIARIAQKARAAGIHMILATQRPSVDVITGLIKANVPTRIAFQVSSRIDSRTILDQQGAEQLLGHGDMLYLAPGSGIPTRIHGAFVSDEEVHAVVKALKQMGEPDYAEDILGGSHANFGNGLGGSFEQSDDGEQDELYDEAVQIVIETRRSSISHLQRRLKIGYNRAARLIETMEMAGVVGPMQSNGNREVLVGSIED